MFEKKNDGEYGFSRRFWAQVIILGLLVCAIGFSTQRTANRTEELSQETIAYAEQTNHCLESLLQVLNQRAVQNKELDDLVDQRARVFEDLMIGLAKVPTDIPLAERDRLAAPIVAKFIAENGQINTDRAAALAKRGENPIPTPECANKLPGQ